MSSLSTDDTLKRLSVDLTEVEHRVLKGHAAKAGLSMRDLVSQVLRREGLLSRSGRPKATVQGASSAGTTTTSIQSDEANAEEAEAASE
jgi:hypothetical protein